MMCVWRLSVAYIGPKSRTERPRKTEIGTEVAHVRRDLDTTFKVKRSKVNLQGAGAYCGGLPHSLLLLLKFSTELVNRNLVKITAWLEVQGGPKRTHRFYRGPGMFNIPLTSSVISRPTCFSSSLRCCWQVGSAPFVRRRCDCLASSAPTTNFTYLLTYLP